LEYLITNKATLESAFGNDLIGHPTALSGGSHSLLQCSMSPLVLKWALSHGANPNLPGTGSSLPFSMNCFSESELLSIIIQNASTDLKAVLDGTSFARRLLESPSVSGTAVASLIERGLPLPRNSLYVARCASKFLEQMMGIAPLTGVAAPEWSTIAHLLELIDRSTSERLVSETLLQWIQLLEHDVIDSVHLRLLIDFCSGPTLQQLEQVASLGKKDPTTPFSLCAALVNLGDDSLLRSYKSKIDAAHLASWFSGTPIAKLFTT
jgi:hypothetical protein